MTFSEDTSYNRGGGSAILNKTVPIWVQEAKENTLTATSVFAMKLNQGILKGEVSLYHWPPVWLIWNQLYDNRQFLFLFSKQANPNQSNRRSMVQWYFPFSIPWVNSCECCFTNERFYNIDTRNPIFKTVSGFSIPLAMFKSPRLSPRRMTLCLDWRILK